MTGERSARDIQREIELARAALGRDIDEFVARTNPTRVAANVRRSLRIRAQSPEGRVVLGLAGVWLASAVVRRIRRR